MPLLAVRGNGPAGAYGFGAASEKPAAMTAIASNTLSATSSSVTFSSIPSTYDDLRLVVFSRVDTSGGYFALRFNSDTATNYSNTYIFANGTSSLTSRNSATDYISPELSQGYNSVQPAAMVVDVINYATTSYNKTALLRLAQDTNTTGNATSLSAGLWRSTNAITSVTVHNLSYLFNPGSVFALYGIKKAA